jgi:hypothetical protein
MKKGLKRILGCEEIPLARLFKGGKGGRARAYYQA